jgi:hypothetical protein
VAGVGRRGYALHRLRREDDGDGSEDDDGDAPAAQAQTFQPTDTLFAVTSADSDLLTNKANKPSDGLDISGDGLWAIAGARRDDSPSSDAGSAYIFRRESEDPAAHTGEWVEDDRITSQEMSIRFPDRYPSAGFGVAIDQDGDRVAIGAPRADPYQTSNGNNSEIGAIFVFERDNNGDWNEVVKLAPDQADVTQYQFAGQDVSISGDGQTVAAGMVSDDNAGSDAGAVYVFEEQADGTWPNTQLIPSDADADDKFGYSVSINETGDRLAAGALNGDPGTTTDAGRVFVYNKDGTGWNMEDSFGANNPNGGNKFGHGVAISDDGNYVVAGEPKSGSDVGTAYAFVRDGTGTWSLDAKYMTRTR